MTKQERIEAIEKIIEKEFPEGAPTWHYDTLATALEQAICVVDKKGE